MKSLVVPAVILSLLLQGPAAADGGFCTSSYYGGFDSRLAVSTVAVLPPDVGSVVAFQVSGGIPFVASSHRVLRLDPNGISALSSLDEITGLILRRSGELTIATTRGLRKIGSGGFVPETAVGVQGRLFDDGNPLFLQISNSGDAKNLSILNTRGKQFPIIRSTIPFRAVGWNQIGFSAVAEDALMTWTAGSPRFEAIAVDTGLTQARDTCLISDGRVAVALAHAVLLVSRKDRAVLAAMRARLRFEDGALYVLDEERGRIFSVRGLDKVGSPESDAAYARELLKAPTKEHILEAARILGCQEVEKQVRR